MKKTTLILITLNIFISCFAQDNQNIEAPKLKNGRYIVYKNIYKDYKSSLVKATKTWPVEIFIEGDKCPKILIKKVGLIDEFYTADLPDYPAYYYSDQPIVITVIDKKIYYYEWSSKSGADLKYVLTNEKINSLTIEKETIDTYRRTISNKQSGAKNSQISKNNAKKEQLEKENSLKGKSIKSISLKLVNSENEIGMFSVVSVGMIVKLTNGKVLKTKNLGGLTPYTDFEFDVKGGDFAGGDFKVANDVRKISNDKFEIIAWSKYNKTIKGKFEQLLNYKSDVFFIYMGRGGKSGYFNASRRNGTDGGDAKSINVAATKLTINGESIIELRVTEASTGRLMSVSKLNKMNIATFNLSGGGGGSGVDGNSSNGDGGSGGNGGNGGNLTITGSGANELNTVIIINGGSGGTGGSAKESYNNSGYNGRNGQNGYSNK